MTVATIGNRKDVSSRNRRVGLFLAVAALIYIAAVIVFIVAY